MSGTPKEKYKDVQHKTGMEESRPLLHACQAPGKLIEHPKGF